MIITFEMHLSPLHSLHLDSLIRSFVALQLDTASSLVSNEALVTLQHQDGSVDQVEEVPRVLLHALNISKQVSRLLVSDKFT